jgi:hypothetical protein
LGFNRIIVDHALVYHHDYTIATLVHSITLLCAGFRQERRVRDEDDERPHEDHKTQGSGGCMSLIQHHLCMWASCLILLDVVL